MLHHMLFHYVTEAAFAVNVNCDPILVAQRI
jgi:hypothetical protein